MKKILLITTLCSLVLLGCSSGKTASITCTKDSENERMTTQSEYELFYEEKIITKIIITAEFKLNKEADIKEEFKTLLAGQKEQVKDVKQLNFEFSNKGDVFTTVTTTNYKGVDANDYVDYGAFQASINEDGYMNYKDTKGILKSLGFTCSDE